ncbi:MAG TPA: M48 family metallopeptidase [bacterium]|nr:M48 family metallopeptidase [bacterium]
MKITPKKADDSVNLPKINQGAEFLILCAGILGIILIIYLMLGFAVDKAVPHIPRSVEKALAMPFLKMYEDGKRDAVELKLQAIVDSMNKFPAGERLDITVHMIYSKDVNAVAFPGGNMAVYAGLLKEVKSENELAFILAHEMGHFYNKDHLRGMGRGLVVFLMSSAILGAESHISKSLASALSAAQLKYSRDQERAADLFALDRINDRYGHAAGAVEIFERLGKKQKIPDYVYYFTTHPNFSDRIRLLNERIKEKGYRIKKTKPLQEAVRAAADLK